MLDAWLRAHVLILVLIYVAAILAALRRENS